MRTSSAASSRVSTLLIATIACVACAGSLIAQRAPTVAQMAASDAKIRSAAAVIDKEWAKVFAGSGDKYTTPHITGYLGSISTPCGVIESDNAYACRLNGSIYYDRAFLATLMSDAASSLGTDGDLAAIFPIAHEWGHAVQYMVYLDYTNSPGRIEPDADCLAGAIIGKSNQDGYLERGDIEEAEFALNVAGDPPLTSGVWGRAIESINRSAAPGTTPVISNTQGNHGNRRERVAAFHNGLKNGPRQCILGIPVMQKTTRSPWLPPLP